MPKQMTLESGVVIKLRGVSSEAFRRALSTIDKPTVPTVTLKDGASEENPNDPDYKVAMDNWAFKVTEMFPKICIALGVHIVSTPDDMYPIDSDGWISEMASIGVTVDTSNDIARASDYKILYALSGTDWNRLALEVMKMGGTMEASIAEAAFWLSRLNTGSTNSEATTKEPTTDGDIIRASSATSGEPVRGNGSGESVPDTVEKMVQPAAF